MTSVMRLRGHSSIVTSKRTQSTVAIISDREPVRNAHHQSPAVSQPVVEHSATGLNRVPTAAILRNLFLGAMISSPLLFRFGSRLLDSMANTRSTLANPDLNPILRAIVKPLFYDQFCAGTDQKEILVTRDRIRRMGFAGVVLCYGKEMQLSVSNELHSTGKGCDSQALEIEHWKQGNLETLDMTGAGDWLGMKYVSCSPLRGRS